MQRFVTVSVLMQRQQGLAPGGKHSDHGCRAIWAGDRTKASHCTVHCPREERMGVRWDKYIQSSPTVEEGSFQCVSEDRPEIDSFRTENVD